MVANQKLNEQIRATNVLVIGEDGSKIGVMATRSALQLARDKDLDLMEVSSNNGQTICKIVNYGKLKYEMAKKQKNNTKHQDVIKEIRVRCDTAKHDVDVKLSHIKEFLSKGFKVKFVFVMEGREQYLVTNPQQRMTEIVQDIQDLAIFDPISKGEKYNEGQKITTYIMMIRPKIEKNSAKK